MFERFVTAIEPFALTLIILSGAALAGWIQVSNHYPVGVATVFCGMLLVVRYIARQMKTENATKSNKKG